jgi:hypothetical protein
LGETKIELVEARTADHAASGARPPGRLVARLIGVTLVTALTGVLALAAFYYLFSSFQEYDDEGYVLITQKQFAAGYPLYDRLFSQYGPFFYWVHWFLFRLGVPIGHDAAGWLTVFYWVTSALFAGLFVYRVTRSLIACLVGEVALTAGLFMLAYEPGHPQAICVWLLTLLLLLASFINSQNRTALSCAIGAVLGCLLLTKVNVGLFALVAVALTLTAGASGRLTAVPCLAACGAALALPAVLMRTHLGQPWGRAYATIVTLSLLPIVTLQCLHAFTARRRVDDSAEINGHGIGGWLAGCFGALAVISVATLISGTSVRGLFYGVLWQHRDFPSVFSLALPIDAPGARAALVGTALFYVAFLLTAMAGHRAWFDGVLAIGKLILTVVIFRFTSIAFAIDPNGQYGHASLLAYGLPFAWLCAFPNGYRRDWGSVDRSRMLLLSLAGLNALVAYPVAGTQQCLATSFLNIVAAVCLADSLRWLARLLPEKLLTPHLKTGWALLAGLAVLAVPAHVGWRLHKLYAGFRVAFNLTQTTWRRADEEHVALYRWLSLNLAKLSDTFVTEPGINSLYLWAEKDPPTTYNTTHWMTMFSPARQAEIVQAINTHPHACAVRKNQLTKDWLDRSGRRMTTQEFESLPLVRAIENDFTTAGIFAGYELRVRGPTVPELTECVQTHLPRWNGTGEPPVWKPRLTLPPLAGRQLTRLAIGNQRYAGSIADTAGVPDALVMQVIDAVNHRPVDLEKNPIDLSKGTPIEFWVDHSEVIPRNVPLFVRLYDSKGLFDVVPILEDH